MPKDQGLSLQTKAKQKVRSHITDYRVYLAIIIVLSETLSLTGTAWAAPGQFCFENIQCATQALTSQPWTTSKTYFDAFFQFGGNTYTLTIFWGVLLGILWLRTQSPMLVMIVGIIVATTAIGLNNVAVGIGLMIASVGLGITLFTIIRQRTSVLSF